MQSYSILQIVIFMSFLLLIPFLIKNPISCYFETINYQTTPQGQAEMIKDLKYSIVVFVGKNITNEITYLRCN